MVEAARAELLTAAADLVKATGELSTKLGKAETFATETREIAERCDRTSHRQTRIVGVMVGVLVVLAAVVAGLIVALVRIENTNNRSIRNQEYAEASCTSANATRAEAKGLWDGKGGIIELIAPPGKKLTPELKKFTDALQVRVNSIYALRDCSKVAEGKVK